MICFGPLVAASVAAEQAISGESGDVKKRFSGNADCQNAYKNYLCWINFPRCNDESESLILCLSVCENYFKSCKVSWRRGECTQSWCNVDV